MKEENSQDTDVDEEVFQSTILYIYRVESWIMTVVKCLCMEGARGTHKQKKYVESFQEHLPAISQITPEMSTFGDDECEVSDPYFRKHFPKVCNKM